MKNKRLALLLVAVTGMLIASCDIHQMPYGNNDVSIMIALYHETAMPEFRDVDLGTKAASEGQERPYVRRYTVRAYRQVTPDAYSKIPYASWIFREDVTQPLDRRFAVNLPPDKYRIMVWTDYVGREPYYNADYFDKIRIVGEYTGADPMHDAFRGHTDIDLTDYLAAGGFYEMDVMLERPMAAYRFIATDKSEYEQLWLRQLEERGIFGTKAEDLDFGSMVVRFAYQDFLPDVYNMFMDKPSDAHSGYWFDGKMEASGSDVIIGSDYVFVNPGASSLVVSFGIYDASGTRISAMQDIELPLYRGELTTVRGNFFTCGSTSGVVINPGFDGEHVIEIN